MPAFEFIALDKIGRTQKGILEGDTEKHIRQQLREKSLTPLSINSIAGLSTIKYRRPNVYSVGATDLALLTRQLATLSRSGLDLAEALKAIAEQADKPKLKALMTAVRAKVVEGHSLAEGLNDFPRVFSEMYRATVAAGEQSGHLDVVLERLADYTENRQHMRQKTLLVLFYPLLLTSVAILVVVGLLTYVVPQVVQVFTNTHQTLPWLTSALISVSGFLQAWWPIILLVIIIIFFSLYYALRFEKNLVLLHHFLLYLPIISRLTRGMNVARFTRTLSILSTSGVPMLEALHITQQVIINRPMRQAVKVATQRVKEGSTLHYALAQSRLFPPMTVHLIASGEASGNLSDMLERAAVTQERELETLTGVLLGLFEPILILTMGAVVLIIVLAILLPIFELNQLIQ